MTKSVIELEEEIKQIQASIERHVAEGNEAIATGLEIALKRLEGELEAAEHTR